MDAAAQEPQNQESKTRKEVQPENPEVAPKFNGTILNPTAAVDPDESQTTISEMTISEHLAGETVEYVSSWPKWHTEEPLEL